MRARFGLNGLIVVAAALVALFLTVTRPSPAGLVSFGVGDREVRAAPGATTPAADARHELRALKLINKTLVRIRDSYVDPSRIDPKKMLFAALDSVQLNIPEVLVEARPDRDEITVLVNDKKERFSTIEVDSPWRLSAKLKKIFGFIEANMNPGADLAKVEYAAVNGMLSTLDPHSLLLDPEMAREMEVATRASFGGVGIVVGMRDEKLTVLKPMPETPAARAGLKAKDHIYRIDGDLTENLTTDEAVERMRGDPGSPIVLTIKREGVAKPLRFELRRASIEVPSVKWKNVDGVGYIRLSQFSDDTALLTAKALGEFKRAGVRGYVLDLRGNPGGLLEEAIKVSDLFVSEGTIVTTVDNDGRDARRAERDDEDVTAPLVVLVSDNSASASEILAGALKNLDRALLIGETTFGKGSVQILYDNNDRSKLKLTIAQYLTPGDQSIQSIGITPDIELLPEYVRPKRTDPEGKEIHEWVRLLPSTVGYRERDLKQHLDSTYAKAGPRPELSLPYVYVPPVRRDAVDGDAPDQDPAEAEDEEDERDEVVVDFPIALARDIVKAGTGGRKELLRVARRLVDRRRADEAKHLVTELAKLGVDWSAAPVGAPHPALDARFAFPGAGDAVRAGREIELVGTVTNTGNVPAFQVHARVASDDRLFKDAELPFGRIEPGKTRTYAVKFKVEEEDVDRLSALRFDVREATGGKHQAPATKIRIAAADHPVFAYGHQLIDEGNRDGLVQPGERFRLRVVVKNTGTGAAAEAYATLRNASGVDLSLETAKAKLGRLEPGQEKTVEFQLASATAIPNPKVVVELNVINVYPSGFRDEALSDKLEYEVFPNAGPAAAAVQAATGAVEPIASAQIHAGADDGATVIATAGPGAVLRVTGRRGDWLRVALDDARPGFLAAAAVRRTTASPRNTGVVTRLQVSPPSLAVETSRYEVTGGSYTLKGVATDETHVEDVYVFVSNETARIENRKVFYQSNRGGKDTHRLPFSAQIPLWPGPNLVTVFSRENDSVRAVHQLYLFRSDAVQTAATSPKPGP